MNAAASALGEHRFKLIAMASIPYPYRTRRKLYLVNFFVDTKMNYNAHDIPLEHWSPIARV